MFAEKSTYSNDTLLQIQTRAARMDKMEWTKTQALKVTIRQPLLQPIMIIRKET